MSTLLSNGLENLPSHVFAESPVGQYSPRNTFLGLPLHLAITVLSYVKDADDISRLSRTCRLLRYLALPQLYHTVTLHASPDLGTCNGNVPGVKYTSSFASGLETLVTRNVAQNVRALVLTGNVKVPDDLEGITNTGRIPDEFVMLSLVIRMAIEKMALLSSFRWELNVPPPLAVYEGLSLSKNLTSLYLRFPSTYVPRPRVVIPPIPGLKKLTISNIDRKYFPDDVSLLVVEARKLKDLTLHFSPRLREESDSNFNLGELFWRFVNEGRKLPITKCTVMNMYTRRTIDLDAIYDTTRLEELTVLNKWGHTSRTDIDSLKMESTWMKPPRLENGRLRLLRTDDTSRKSLWPFSQLRTLEEVYFVNSDEPKTEASGYSPEMQLDPPSDAPDLPDWYCTEQTTVALKTEFLDDLLRNGPNLKNLCLSIHWAMDMKDLEKLVTGLPNLQQLAIQLYGNVGGGSRFLVENLKKLRVLRVLNRTNVIQGSAEQNFTEKLAMKHFEKQVEQSGSRTLEWIGAEACYYRFTRSAADGFRPKIKKLSWDDVKDIAIFKYDSYDLIE